MPISKGMSCARSRIARQLLPIALGCALALAPAASAAELRSAGRLHVTRVGTDSISLKWRDRSRGETRYEVLVDGAGARRVKIPRNRESVQIGGLERGSRYEARVRACRRKRCGPSPRSVRTATLLAPFNGPHPDPRCGTFPGSDEFNRDVSGAPVDPRSDRIIAQINSDGADLLHPDFGSNPSYGIPFVVVPFRQPSVPVDFTAYGDESDRGPYPIPPGAPVEGGARSDGDRHVIVVRRPAESGGDCTLSELYRAFERGGSRNRWKADSGAIFDLGSPLAGQRPDGWTSADAAGLPIYPGLVTLEEVRSGEIDHAIRVTFEETRRGYISPATHYASDSCDPDRPPMGLRLRLRGGYDLSGFHGDSKVIATALKRYGVINADNGSNWFISGSTDRRWDDEDLNQLKDIPGSAFEVVRRGPETTAC
jgi:hypothetical protein